MKNLHQMLFIVILLSGSVARGEATSKIDDTVAAGLIFKISYLLGCHGPWQNINENSPEAYTAAIKVISNDLTSFSDTKYGRDLRDRAKTLITFLNSVRSTADDEQERATFLRGIGLDPTNVDQIKLAQILTDKISDYANKAHVPPWVYDNSQNENK